MDRMYVVTIMAADRPGIVAHLGQAIAGLGGSIEELSQTVMRGFFTMLVYARIPAGASAVEVHNALCAGMPSLNVAVREDDGSVASEPPPGERLILTARGADRPGLIGGLGGFLAGRDLNIEDMSARVDPATGEYVMILQVHWPRERDLRQLQLDLAELADDLGMTVHLQHENVFKATNEISAVRALTL